jgi:hypothetical protein
MDLYLFRLTLKEKEPDLFSVLNNAALSREEWLRNVFQREHRFRHYQTNFIYEPELSGAAPSGASLLFGWFGREKRTTERTPPDEGFQPTEHLAWQAVFVAVDPTHHDDGQKIAIENNYDIGRPRAILNSFIREINGDLNSPFYIAAFPIIEKGTFWDFASHHQNEIVSLSFDVAVPNMFDGVSDFERELRALRDNENVSEVDTKLKSDGLLKHNSERISSIINYVERGGGELEAVAFDGAEYKSSDHEAHVSIDTEHHSSNIAQFWRDLRNLIDRVFP